jgi:hypothetical protein
MPIRAYYSDTIRTFLNESNDRIIGILATEHHHALEQPQRWAWSQQLKILKSALIGHTDGRMFLEFYIPRMGKRADAVLIIADRVFVIEFKVGARDHSISALEQVEDYALDLKKFHEGSHTVPIISVLVSTEAESELLPELIYAEDLLAAPIRTNKTDLRIVFEHSCNARSFPYLDIDK